MPPIPQLRLEALAAMADLEIFRMPMAVMVVTVEQQRQPRRIQTRQFPMLVLLLRLTAGLVEMVVRAAARDLGETVEQALMLLQPHQPAATQARSLQPLLAAVATAEVRVPTVAEMVETAATFRR